MFSVEVARYIIAFSWIYHGLAPKLIKISPLEQLMSSSLGWGEEATYLFIKAAGVGAVMWGLIFFVLYKVRGIIALNIVALLGLLLAVVTLQPQLLIEAFNPVTTNVPLIALSIIVYHHFHSGSVKS